ncbi:hypothetical protein G6F40_016743 [Rhizopus arrhizus]|nr:hypothetical protein G6F40_016743 [Rhizopus arrhizus]
MGGVAAFLDRRAALDRRRGRRAAQIDAGAHLLRVGFRDEVVDRVLDEARVAELDVAVRKRAAPMSLSDTFSSTFRLSHSEIPPELGGAADTSS